MTLRDDLVKKLETENDELRERCRTLEEIIGISIDAPIILGLTGQEASLFGMLLKRDMVTKEAAMFGLYGARTGGGDVQIKIVDVFICKLRKKLRCFGIEVETVWGRGYSMPATSRAIAQGLLSQARAA